MASAVGFEKSVAAGAPLTRPDCPAPANVVTPFVVTRLIRFWPESATTIEASGRIIGLRGETKTPTLSVPETVVTSTVLTATSTDLDRVTPAAFRASTKYMP